MVVTSLNIPHKDDLLNVGRKRNIRNVDKDCYNCGGYALETFSWYIPSDSTRGWDWSVSDSPRAVMYRTNKARKKMLADFPDMREIRKLDELAPNEYAIAFRVSSDGDFHFVKRAKNNHWYHKRGRSWEIDQMSQAEVFAGNWCGRYDGPLVLFAKKMVA